MKPIFINIRLKRTVLYKGEESPCSLVIEIRALMIITPLKLYTNTTAGQAGQSKCFFLCITCFYVFIYSTNSLIISSSSAIHRRNFFGWHSPPLSLRDNRYYIICLAAMPHTPRDTLERVPQGLVFQPCSIWINKERRMLCRAPWRCWSAAWAARWLPLQPRCLGGDTCPRETHMLPFALVACLNKPLMRKIT